MQSKRRKVLADPRRTTRVFEQERKNLVSLSCRVKGREKSKDTQVPAKRRRQVDKKILVENRHCVSRYTSEPIEFYEAR